MIVAIVGLGQIGGSLASALTRRRLARVVGVTRRAETAARARRMGILAEAGTDLDAISAADLVVLATPVRTLVRQIPDILARLRPGALLTDVASTKGAVHAAFRKAGPRVPYIGGHPMAGSERVGLDGCDPGIFLDRPWILIPTPGGRRGLPLLERLVRGVGARTIVMKDPAGHDLAVARISHVPYLLGYSLALQPASALRVAGNSFRDATRVALSDPEMVLDFLLTNPRGIARAAAELSQRLLGLARKISGGKEAALRRLIERARSARGRM